MPALNELVVLINSALQQSTALNVRKLQTAKYYGIADQVKTTGEETEKVNPYIIDDETGDGIEVSFNDIYPMQLYHRIIDVRYSEDTDSGFGDPGIFEEEIATMRIVAMGSRRILLLRPEQIIAAIVVSMPKEFAPADITGYQLSSCKIETGTVNTNCMNVWADEFQGTAYSLDTNDYIVSLDYTITSTFNKNCFSIC